MERGYFDFFSHNACTSAREGIAGGCGVYRRNLEGEHRCHYAARAEQGAVRPELEHHVVWAHGGQLPSRSFGLPQVANRVAHEDLRLMLGGRHRRERRSGCSPLTGASLYSTFT